MSGLGNGRYDTLCAGLEGNERSGKGTLRSLCCTVEIQVIENMD